MEDVSARQTFESLAYLEVFTLLTLTYLQSSCIVMAFEIINLLTYLLTAVFGETGTYLATDGKSKTGR